ncbi:MAG: hypothetical protein A3G32_05165 [Deltaproteobacteria bacterium RIFCSPLOWO2_12_FULL_40_28]|nr:MAG: hypothetical protein A3C45_09275 [Deltaproteobacteria bacterium RIFCSPHIGHO2_02_FULL_40_28]OGQ19751.1 MAG: hypothetical protein A3E27_08470 [Deltaproteobacteria bacterium RIFCSPHIGHO2_12_FULL_40_32]OGQ41028.1 MAG: hypothetical protein A3I69_03885 [Deltaproteobacteria bacterium RIFCSPLOWO2_02_FULL_40_36]OGQ54144.1 MAG: hypothetical protein A3G32_05165 [Deltaproteobacteria bacterium RIFCSPLOWO2_12_FULL_40_28]
MSIRFKPVNARKMKQKLAIVGLGSAGRSRLKALETSSHFDLGGIVSRRAELATSSWEKTLSDPQISCVAISTENSLHPQLVKEALQHKKHVLCDYPLAFSMEKAKELFDLAKKSKKILHVEHIALLSNDHQMAKTSLFQLGTLKEGSYLFEGGWQPKWAKKDFAGPESFIPEARLLQIMDWLENFEIQKQKLICNEKNFLFEAKLIFSQRRANQDSPLHKKNEGILSFTEKRQAGLERRRNFRAHFENGDYEWKYQPTPEGLFARDLEHFYHRITNGTPCYYSEKNMLKLTEQLSQIKADK